MWWAESLFNLEMKNIEKHFKLKAQNVGGVFCLFNAGMEILDVFNHRLALFTGNIYQFHCNLANLYLFVNNSC